MIMKRLMLCILLLSGCVFIKLSADIFVVDSLRYRVVSKEKMTVSVSSTYTNELDTITESVVIPPSVTYNDTTYTVTSVDRFGFWYCLKLSSISLPETIDTIRYRAFAGLDKLEQVEIPSSVKVLEAGVFSSCFKLKHVKLPAKIDFIGSDCFKLCTKLEDSIVIRKGTEYGTGVYTYCRSIKHITIEPGVTKIPNEMFNNYDDMTYPLIPLEVEDIVIPESVDTIGRAAFALSKLKTLKLPSCKVMGKEAFAHNRWLETVTFGNKVEHVRYSAFNGSSSLKTIYCESIIPPKEGSYVKGATLHVPKGCKEIYATTDNWAKYGENIVDDIELSGIHSSQVISNDSDGPTYDLQGRRVAHPKQGEIYIQKGKKTRK